MKTLIIATLVYTLFFPTITFAQKSDTEKQSQAETYLSWWLIQNDCWYNVSEEMTNFANRFIDSGKIYAFENHQMKFWQDLTGTVKKTFPGYDYSECYELTPEKKALEWAANNLWFRVNDDMTDYAVLIHGKLIAIGIDPIDNSEEYYGEIDRQMRMKFPDYDWK